MKKYILALLTIVSFFTVGKSQIRGLSGLVASSNTLDLNYADPKEYEISEITTEGSKFYDANSMITLSGLKVGDKIKVPGEALSSAIKKLMKHGILDNVEIHASKIEASKIALILVLIERPRLYALEYTGIRKGEIETLNEKVKAYKGKIITETLQKNLELIVKRHYQEKGYLNIQIKTSQKIDSTKGNNATLQVKVEKGEKVKVNQIIIEGRTEVSEKTFKRKLKETKQMRFGRIFKPSKYIPVKFEEDKKTLATYYSENGYRDFVLVSDSVYKFDDKSVNIKIKVDEGKKYHYRNIYWEGNFIYPDSVLADVLGIKKGDVYNTTDLEKRMNGKPGEDLSSVYMDNGYLYYNAEPIESSIVGDSIDITMRIAEGKQATINKIIVNGNTKTSDHVVLREIRTLPGQKFSKSAIIRTVRELSTIGYFDPEKISPNPQPRPDGTVDIEYNLEEKPSDQIELSGGWGGYVGFIGTLGIVFNNFSLRNIFNLKSYKPLPSGDGQKLAVRFQANGSSFQNYSLTFTEPWFGGRKPNSFSVSLNRSISYPNRFRTAFSSQTGSGFNENAHFNSIALSVSLGKRLRVPDDYFSLQNSISFNLYDIEDLNYGFPEGKSTGITFSSNLSRNSIDNPTFPRSGSSFSLSGTLTPPYSAFKKKTTTPVISENTNENSSNLLEYHKWMFDASWFTPLTNKLVFHARAHMGFLGNYGLETTSFERFDVGGSGMQQGFGVNRDIIGLRGYKDRSIGASAGTNPGGVAYNKFVMELRYPISLNPSATIFVLGFAEGGNNFESLNKFTPFKLYKSAGLGARIFMPAFGLIGLDYGWAFDKEKKDTSGEFGQQAFTISIGQQLR
ncbi:MAG: outer membrane protein assembly factor BamA [Pseudarcicella sp.]|nr:outer membrane protein assembly factor BamA [Pseudarcicella sp.]MBP6409547.1 outer membrane protein assembly factor BamA [Pseudarcicella sp.]